MEKESCVECGEVAVVFCVDCKTRGEDNECIEGLHLCEAHDSDYHAKVHHSTVDLRAKHVEKSNKELLQKRKDEKVKEMSYLSSKKHEMEYFKHDLNMEKSCYNRHVRTVVKMLQQEVLSRGRALAKELETTIEQKISKVDNSVGDVNEQMSICLKSITELERIMKLEGEDFTDAYKDIDSQEEQNEDIPPLTLPAEEQWVLDTTALCSIMEQLTWQKKDYVKADLPRQQLNEGETLEVSVAGLWTSQRPAFAVVKRDRTAANALYEYSKLIRRAYLEDKDWKTYQELGESPPVQEPVFAKFNEDNKWYRARVISNDEKRKESEVVLVDYAQVVALKWSSLLPTKEELYTDAPPWAFDCTLAEDINSLTGREARWWFNTTAADISQSCVPIKCTLKRQIEGEGSPAWLVDMEATKPDGSTVDLGQEVEEKLKEGLAPNSRMSSRDIREEFVKHTIIENPKKEAEIQAQKKETQEPKVESAASETPATTAENPPSAETPASTETPSSVETALSASNVADNGDCNDKEQENSSKADEVEKNEHTQVDKTDLSNGKSETVEENSNTDSVSKENDQPGEIEQQESAERNEGEKNEESCKSDEVTTKEEVSQPQIGAEIIAEPEKVINSDSIDEHKPSESGDDKSQEKPQDSANGNQTETVNNVVENSQVVKNIEEVPN